MIRCACPLCESQYAEKGEARHISDAVKFWCQKNCGTFVMDGGFLTHIWPTIRDEDKKAIAAFMKASKDTRTSSSLIDEGNYRDYVTKGRVLQKSGKVDDLIGAE